MADIEKPYSFGKGLFFKFILEDATILTKSVGFLIFG